MERFEMAEKSEVSLNHNLCEYDYLCLEEKYVQCCAEKQSLENANDELKMENDFLKMDKIMLQTEMEEKKERYETMMNAVVAEVRDECNQRLREAEEYVLSIRRDLDAAMGEVMRLREELMSREETVAELHDVIAQQQTVLDGKRMTRSQTKLLRQRLT